MFVSNFPKVIKHLLKDLPQKDYPVLNTFFFTSCWLGWVMDQSLMSMRDLIFRLNSRNIKIDISTQSRIRKLLERENKFFVLRIKNNMKLKMLDNGNCLVGGIKDQLEVRIVNFCNLENRNEYRLATNLNPEEFSHEEIGEIYRCRWGIETFWKFLKMHLKLDRLMTKNENGIRIQIYSCLIVYVILQLIEIPQEIGVKILDKLRYLQSFMNEKLSYIHWFRRLSFSW
jgi:putative transposase